MSEKTTTIILLLIITAMVVLGIQLYPSLPEYIATHWNAEGLVDDYTPKFWGVFMMPLLLTGLLGLFLIIPKVDPLRANIEAFREHYNAFWVVISGFLFYLFGLVMTWNLGYTFNFTIFMIPALVVFWFYIGTLLEHSKRNWFVGIRTPWTMSNDIVWERTHQLGGKLFKLMAVASLSGFFIRDSAFIVGALVIPAMIITLVTVVYSYFEYHKLPHNESESA